MWTDALASAQSSDLGPPVDTYRVPERREGKMVTLCDSQAPELPSNTAKFPYSVPWVAQTLSL